MKTTKVAMTSRLVDAVLDTCHSETQEQCSQRIAVLEGRDSYYSIERRDVVKITSGIKAAVMARLGS